MPSFGTIFLPLFCLVQSQRNGLGFVLLYFILPWLVVVYWKSILSCKRQRESGSGEVEGGEGQ